MEEMTRIHTRAHMGLQGDKVPPTLSGVGSQMPELVGSPHKMALCGHMGTYSCVCMLACVPAPLMHEHPLRVCFSNANLTRGLCVAATARPTSTTVSCIEMPASLDPKSRSTTMDTAKVGRALSAAMGS